MGPLSSPLGAAGAEPPGSPSLPGDLQLVDHHCHGVVEDVPDRAAFELLATESFDPAPPLTSHLDSPIGLAIRRWCAPALGLSPGASVEEYLSRRWELGGAEANRRLLRAAGLSAIVLDTGYRSAEVLSGPAMGTMAGPPCHEVVRLEAVAEEVVARGGDAAGFAPGFRELLWERAGQAVGLKSILAYRGGLEVSPEPPTDAEVTRAAGRWLDSGRARLEDLLLLRFGLWAGAEVAAERGLPLQLHTGFGDPDLTLHLANPSLATGLLRALGQRGVTVVLLHCYPYHREAAYLATVFRHVYFDVGGALGYLGPSGPRLVAEALELAPFSKQLYSSDAFGLAELYLVGAAAFRDGLAAVLYRWVTEGRCHAADAERIARLIGAENARRIYPLGP